MRIGRLVFEGPMRLKLRTLRNYFKVMRIYDRMFTNASIVMHNVAQGWANEYFEKHEFLDDGYPAFIQPKRGEICELVSEYYRDNELGIYIYNDEHNFIRFAYTDGEMKDCGTVIGKCR